MTTENYNSTQDFQWSGLKQQLTNLARFSQPIVALPWIVFVTILFCLFSGWATGWGTALIFSWGKAGAEKKIWEVAGYVFGLAVSFILLMNVIYQYMGKIKLTGDDYGDSLLERGSTTANIWMARATTIIFSAMFIYAQVSSGDRLETSLKENKQTRLQNLEQRKFENKARFDSLSTYFQSLDFDRDTTNDQWSRQQLEKVINKRNAEIAWEDSMYNILMSLPDEAKVEQAGITAIDGTRLLKDLGSDHRPPDWAFRVMLVLLSIVIGFVADGGIMLGGKIIARKKAFDNVSTVLAKVNGVLQELSNGYGGQVAVKSSKVKPSSNGGVDRKGQEKEEGEKIDLNSPKIKKILADIEGHWIENGGGLTFEQIGEMNDGVSKQYISQVFIKAKKNGKIIDPRDL